MFQPLPLFLGLRYARARAHRFFVSFITWVSLLGVAVGVAALIVILSVMNGFGSELRSRLLALSSPVRISAAAGQSADWDALAAQVASMPGVEAAEPYAELQVLAVGQLEMVPVQLRAASRTTLRELAPLIVAGNAAAMSEGSSLILGEIVAEQLGVGVGDPVTLLVPTIPDTQVPEAKLREFTVAAVFEAGIQDHDGSLAFGAPEVLTGLGAARSGSAGLAVETDDALAAPALAQRIQAELATRPVVVTDWTKEHASYFRAIRIEKTMIALILLLVVGVAAFNIVAMLVMVVTDKRTDIAILRTLGAGPGTVARAFVIQGLVIGWIGVLAGVILGVGIATNVDPIVQWLERVFGLHIFDADVYTVTQVPSELHGIDVLLVAGCALLVTAAATIYPSLRAAATSPAEALRYE